MSPKGEQGEGEDEFKRSEWAAPFGAAVTEALGKRPAKWLAEGIGLSPSTVSRILSGERPPTLDQLADIARCLGVSRRHLLQSAGYLDGEGLIDPSGLHPQARDLLLAFVGPRGFGHGLDGKPNDLEGNP